MMMIPMIISKIIIRGKNQFVFVIIFSSSFGISSFSQM